ncbi:hypothetical protein Adt_32026 [Abeliophyllum distichum]|uniref:Uncharacterized protein n=1 Tax=Abeliophyllum distichum TaxID=126358 RepID=A0ABD1NYD6_9LAMI
MSWEGVYKAIPLQFVAPLLPASSVCHASPAPPFLLRKPSPLPALPSYQKNEKMIATDETDTVVRKHKASLSFGEGLMRDAWYVRQTEEASHSESIDAPLPTKKRVDGANCINVIFQNKELSSSILEMLPSPVSEVAACVYKFWFSLWKKVVEQATLSKLITMAMNNNVRGFALSNKLFNVVADFEGKLKKFNTRAKETFQRPQGDEIDKHQIGSENEALRYKVEVLASVIAILKIKLEAVVKDMRQAKNVMLDAQNIMRATDNAWR